MPHFFICYLSTHLSQVDLNNCYKTPVFSCDQKCRLWEQAKLDTLRLCNYLAPYIKGIFKSLTRLPYPLVNHYLKISLIARDQKCVLCINSCIFADIISKLYSVWEQAQLYNSRLRNDLAQTRDIDTFIYQLSPSP